jgi:fumarate reductase flavoprotein subunit
VNLDLRHLGDAKLRERLPQIRELAREFLGIDPAHAPIPVRRRVHYTMGGIPTDVKAAAPLPGLYAAGECASSGIHGANRLGLQFARRALRLRQGRGRGGGALRRQAARQRRVASLAGAGRAGAAHREPAARAAAEPLARNPQRDGARWNPAAASTARTTKSGHVPQIAELRERCNHVTLADRAAAWNTEWLGAIELGYQLDVSRRWRIRRSSGANRAARTSAWTRIAPRATTRNTCGTRSPTRCAGTRRGSSGAR